MTGFCSGAGTCTDRQSVVAVEPPPAPIAGYSFAPITQGSSSGSTPSEETPGTLWQEAGSLQSSILVGSAA